MPEEAETIIINTCGFLDIAREESIESMENELKNVSLEKENLIVKINSIIENYNIKFIGLHAVGLTEGILMCKK